MDPTTAARTNREQRQATARKRRSRIADWARARTWRLKALGGHERQDRQKRRGIAAWRLPKGPSFAAVSPKP